MQKNKLITLLIFCVTNILEQDVTLAQNLDLNQIRTDISNNSIVNSNSNLSFSEHTHTPFLQDPRNIRVNIQLQPAHYLKGKAYVSTSDNLTATAEIEDEKFRNLTLTYQWSTKNETIITNSNATTIVYRFSKPDEDNFLKVLVVHRPDDTGSKQKNLVVKDPISMATPIGKLFLEHGELLKITIKFNGTGPFTYCHRFCRQDIGNCDECQLGHSYHSFTYSNEVNITQYLHNVGNYTLLFIVDNIVSRLVKPYKIEIIDTVRKHTTSYVPIVCSISAVFILLTGLVLHLKLKRTVYTETADFDFTRQNFEDEEWDDEEQSFFQRIRYILRAERESNQTSWINSSLNGSRSRLMPS